MTTKNLSIKYYISLVSDIAKKSDANAKALENATKRQNKALEQTEKAATKTDKVVTAVGKATSVGKVQDDAKRATAALEQTTAAARRVNDALNRVGTGRSSRRTQDRRHRNRCGCWRRGRCGHGQATDVVRCTARQHGERRLRGRGFEGTVSQA